MRNKIFLGNLPYSATETAIIDMFPAVLIEKIDMQTIEDGRPSGFAVVTVTSDVAEAITAINGSELDRRLVSATEYLTY